MTKSDPRGRLHDETGKFVAKAAERSRMCMPHGIPAGGHAVRCGYCGGRCIVYHNGWRGRECFKCKLRAALGEPERAKEE